MQLYDFTFHCVATYNWRVIDCTTLRLSHAPVQPRNRSNVTRPFPARGFGSGNETTRPRPSTSGSIDLYLPRSGIWMARALSRFLYKLSGGSHRQLRYGKRRLSRPPVLNFGTHTPGITTSPRPLNRYSMKSLPREQIITMIVVLLPWY